MAEDPDPDLGFRMYGRLGNDGGTAQLLKIDYLKIAGFPEGGEFVVDRVIDHGSGGALVIGHAFEPGTMLSASMASR